MNSSQTIEEGKDHPNLFSDGDLEAIRSIVDEALKRVADHEADVSIEDFENWVTTRSLIDQAILQAVGVENISVVSTAPGIIQTYFHDVMTWFATHQGEIATVGDLNLRNMSTVSSALTQLGLIERVGYGEYKPTVLGFTVWEQLKNVITEVEQKNGAHE